MEHLIRWLAGRSLRTLHALGVLLGGLAYALSPTYRRRLAAHVAQAGLGAPVRRAAVASAGRMVAELPWLWLRPADRPLGATVQWQGAELLEAALAQPQGTVILTPHLGCFEVCAQAIAERFGDRCPLTVMYRPARQPWLRRVIEASRARPGLLTQPASLAGVRQMIRALRRGEAVGLLPDQVPPQGMGVWAPFFGRPAYTMTLATRLVQQTGAQLLLMWGERLPGGGGFRLHVSAPPRPLPASADNDELLQIACATTLNQAMEQLILQCPGQYLWGYHRFKAPRQAPAAAAPEGGG